MGLFGGGTQEPVNPVLLEKLISSDASSKHVHKALGRAQAQILADVGSEDILMVATGGFNLVPGVLVITPTRVLAYRKDRLDKSLQLADVHSTILGTMPRGSMLVQIRTFKSELDFRPDDYKRYEHYIQMELDTARPAQAICATIDGITGRP